MVGHGRTRGHGTRQSCSRRDGNVRRLGEGGGTVAGAVTRRRRNPGAVARRGRNACARRRHVAGGESGPGGDGDGPGGGHVGWPLAGRRGRGRGRVRVSPGRVRRPGDGRLCESGGDGGVCGCGARLRHGCLDGGNGCDIGRCALSLRKSELRVGVDDTLGSC